MCVFDFVTVLTYFNNRYVNIVRSFVIKYIKYEYFNENFIDKVVKGKAICYIIT